MTAMIELKAAGLTNLGVEINTLFTMRSEIETLDTELNAVIDALGEYTKKNQALIAQLKHAKNIEEIISIHINRHTYTLRLMQIALTKIEERMNKMCVTLEADAVDIKSLIGMQEKRG